MGWFEFIAAIVGSIAWPAAVVWVVFLLRHQIRALIPSLSRFQAGPIQAEFRETLEEAEQTKQQLEESEQKALPPIEEELDEDLQAQKVVLYNRAQEDPYQSILNAWFSVMAEAEAAAIRNQLHKERPHLTLRRIVEMLANRGKVPRLLIDYTDQLSRLHEQTVGVEPTLGRPSVTEEEAKRYNRFVLTT